MLWFECLFFYYLYDSVLVFSEILLRSGIFRGLIVWWGRIFRNGIGVIIEEVRSILGVLYVKWECKEGIVW